MNEVKITKIKKALSSYEKMILNTSDEELREMSKDFYVYHIKDLALLEKQELSVYENKLNSLNISSEKIKEIINDLKKIKEKELITEEETKEKQIEENIEIKKVSEEAHKEDLETYIFTNVYRNKNQSIGDEHQKLVLKLQQDLKNPNEQLIKTWIKNYVSFANKYKDELDKNKLIEYISELFKTYDKEKKYTDKLEDYIKEAESGFSLPEKIQEQENNKDETKENEEPLKIINIKKSFKNKNELLVLGTTALIGIGGLAFGAPPLIAMPIAAIIWKLYRNKGLTSKKLQTFINKNGYTIDTNTKELKDKNGNIITSEMIGKVKYEMLKQYLLKLNSTKDNGEIKKEYKKNRIASKLLSSSLVEKLKVFKKKEANLEENVNENEEIQKGMGLLKK